MLPALLHLDSLRRARCPDSRQHVHRSGWLPAHCVIRRSPRPGAEKQTLDRLSHPSDIPNESESNRHPVHTSTRACSGAWGCRASPHRLMSAPALAGLLLQESVVPRRDDRRPRSQMSPRERNPARVKASAITPSTMFWRLLSREPDSVLEVTFDYAAA